MTTTETENYPLPVNLDVYEGEFTQTEANERARLKFIEEKAAENAGSVAVAALEEARLRADEFQRVAEQAQVEFELLVTRRSSLIEQTNRAKRLLDWCDYTMSDPQASMEEALGLGEGYSPWEDPSIMARIDNYLGALTYYEAKRTYFGKLKDRWTPRLTALEAELAEVEKELAPANKKGSSK
jgi:hypothetical protein